jgi:hypothetical protein
MGETIVVCQAYVGLKSGHVAELQFYRQNVAALSMRNDLTRKRQRANIYTT